MTNSPSIYLDYAAATPLDDTVLAAMQPYFSSAFYNPSATYNAAREVKDALEAVRSRVAHWLGAKNSEIIFTAGGSEANNLAIHGIMRTYPKGNIVVSGVEHDSVLSPSEHYTCRKVNMLSDGRVDLVDLKKKIDKQTVLVSIMQANNEVGTIQPIRQISKLVTEIRKSRSKEDLPLYLHTDACQAANYLDLHTSRLGVDLMTLNGGKIYGPKQSGVLYIRAGIKLRPQIDGGGQEMGMRSGTENIPGIIGLSAALDKAQAGRHEESQRLKGLQKQFITLLQAKIPNVLINGSLKYRLPNNIHLTIPGSDNERLIIELDERGIQAAAGSACSASDEDPSHVLRAMGMSDEEARASLRLTIGRQTTLEEVERTVDVLANLCKKD